MKRKILFSTLAVMGIISTALSQNNSISFIASTVPEKLKPHAVAIYRLDEETLEITSPSHYNTTVHQIVTLLNKDAAHLLHQRLPYNKFVKIENINFIIYDQIGRVTNQYQKKDFLDKDYDDQMSLYTDEKVLYADAITTGYPCTIEISYTTKTNSYVELPDWYISSPREAVEESRFIVKVPKELDIHYQAVNIDLSPSIESVGDIKVYSWLAKDIPAPLPEVQSYEAGSYLPRIEVAPQLFEYDGYKGDLTSWQKFGAWNYKLYEEPTPFNKAQSEQIRSMVASCKTDKEKVKILYDYLKKTMRYVSIQLGIGGFKPFSVQYVEDKKYGDCKALTNYMRYMLKTVGIKSYPALINAGYNKKPADPSFVSDPFNHVILCVPFDKDSIWLECTSNNNECGILGGFTENRNALILTEDGGKLVATPSSQNAKNLLETKTIINIDEDGGSKVSSSIYSTGDFWNQFYEIMHEDADNQKTIFVNYLHYKHPDEFQLQQKSDSATGKLFALELSYEHQYDFKAGSKFFFQPRVNKLLNESISPTLERKYDYVFDFPYDKIDTTFFNLPSGFSIDNLPEKKEISNSYASYKNEYIKNESGNKITVIAKLSIKNRVVPPAAYKDLAIFFNEVSNNENEKIVIRKN